ncbi:trimeric intracellular cation channel family protein, partial [Salmonella enterica subsp. enterica serovar Oslo]|nr:trimeric intracellular cation channel family protein [Salmonella enterica subsp. enterica serovar Oslo]
PDVVVICTLLFVFTARLLALSITVCLEVFYYRHYGE